MSATRSVLVTGASRGIGRAAAQHLADAGWQVFAGVRKLDDAPPGTSPVQLDLTNAEHIAALPGVLPDHLTAVVNNAGFAFSAPVEGLTPDTLREQFEVNVFGHIAVTSTLLPRLRASRGRAVFVTSLGARISTPMTGAYNASKAALESLVDAMRVELAPWGVPVPMIEPGPIDTDMWRGAVDMVDTGDERLPPHLRELYEEHHRGMRRVVRAVQRTTAPTSMVVAALDHALTARRPKERYLIGKQARFQVAAHTLLPTRVFDVALAKATGTPAAGSLVRS